MRILTISPILVVYLSKKRFFENSDSDKKIKIYNNVTSQLLLAWHIITEDLLRLDVQVFLTPIITTGIGSVQR